MCHTENKSYDKHNITIASWDLNVKPDTVIYYINYMEVYALFLNDYLFVLGAHSGTGFILYIYLP